MEKIISSGLAVDKLLCVRYPHVNVYIRDKSMRLSHAIQRLDMR